MHLLDVLRCANEGKGVNGKIRVACFPGSLPPGSSFSLLNWMKNISACENSQMSQIESQEARHGGHVDSTLPLPLLPLYGEEGTLNFSKSIQIR